MIPKLLMLDEPTEGLSPLMVQELQSVLRAIKTGGVTLLIVDLASVSRSRWRTGSDPMSKGRIAQETSSQELRSDSDLRLRYLGV